MRERQRQPRECFSTQANNRIWTESNLQTILFIRPYVLASEAFWLRAFEVHFAIVRFPNVSTHSRTNHHYFHVCEGYIDNLGEVHTGDTVMDYLDQVRLLFHAKVNLSGTSVSRRNGFLYTVLSVKHFFWNNRIEQLGAWPRDHHHGGRHNPALGQAPAQPHRHARSCGLHYGGW